MYVVCEICGAYGHKGKRCPLYRLNEQQTGFGISGARARRAPALALEINAPSSGWCYFKATLVHRSR